MPSIVFAGSRAVEYFVVSLNKLLPSVRVTPNPVLERFSNCLLFLLGKSSLFAVQYTAFLAVGVGFGIVDTHIAEIQRVFEYLICVGSVRAISHIGVHIAVAWLALARDIPFGGEPRIVDLNAAAQIIRWFKGFNHELLDIVAVYPCRAETNLDLACVKVFGLSRLKCSHICCELRVCRERKPRKSQLLAHIAGEILIGGFILLILRIQEDNSGKLSCQRLFGFTCETAHIRHVYLCLFGDRECQCLRSGIHEFYCLMWLYRPFGEHIRFARKVVVLIQHLKGA